MQLGNNIRSLHGKEYEIALRNSRPWDALQMIVKDYSSLVDDLISCVANDRNEDKTRWSKITRYCLYSMSNYGYGEFYDMDSREDFLNDYRNAIKMSGCYIPDEIDTYAFLFEGKDADDVAFPRTIFDETYGELHLIGSPHDVACECDVCGDIVIRLTDDKDLATFLEICYDKFVDAGDFSDDAINYTPYSIITEYVGTMLFNISEELSHDILRLFAAKDDDFKNYLIEGEYSYDLVYRYPRSITETIVTDSIGMLFLYNYKEIDEDSMVLTCIAMMFKNYLERRLK